MRFADSTIAASLFLFLAGCNAEDNSIKLHIPYFDPVLYSLFLRVPMFRELGLRVSRFACGPCPSEPKREGDPSSSTTS